jgi:hypothetical protein
LSDLTHRVFIDRVGVGFSFGVAGVNYVFTAVTAARFVTHVKLLFEGGDCEGLAGMGEAVPGFIGQLHQEGSSPLDLAREVQT